MPLEITFMEEDDAPAFATIDGLVMADLPVAKAMVLSILKEGESRHEVIERWTRQGFRNDSELVWLKVIDTDLNGEIVACALWRFNYDGEMPKIGAATGEANTVLPDAEPKPTIWSALEQSWTEFRNEFIGGRPHANLQICITHPKHQRRGAGSMLVDWGCKKADERGLLGVLTSSAAGLKLYEDFGFKMVKQGTLDLRPYGVDETEIRRHMLRPSKNVGVQ